MRRLLVPMIACIAASCAVMEPPEGGPEDKTPPSIVSFEPAPGSVGVSRTAGLAVTFSEKIDGDSFRGRVRLFPPVDFSGIKAKGDRLEVGFREELPETTFSVVISGGYSDQHNVKNDHSEVFHFSTTSSIDTGTVSGRILFKEKPDSTGVAHLIAVVPGDTIADPATADPARISFAGRDGGFGFSALPTSGERFILWAFTDRNRDGRFSQKDEFSALAADTIELEAGRPHIGGVMIDIIDPNEPGSIAGRIVDRTGLGVGPTARFDGLGEERIFVVRTDTTGTYLLPSVPPGEYVFSAFIDMSGDSLAGTYADPADSTIALPEPAFSPADTVLVRPGARTAVDPVTLRKESPDGS